MEFIVGACIGAMIGIVMGIRKQRKSKRSISAIEKQKISENVTILQPIIRDTTDK